MRFASLACLVLLISCLSSANSPGRAPSGPTDAIDYQARLVKWQRDSTVIDSLSRLVDNRHWATLWAELAAGGNPRVIDGKLACERFRIPWQHGVLPGLAAMARARDSVFRLAGPDALPQIERRMAAYPHVTARRCGDVGPQAPDSVAGTSITGSLGPRPKPRP